MYVIFTTILSSHVLMQEISDRMGLNCLTVDMPFQNGIGYQVTSAATYETTFMGDLHPSEITAAALASYSTEPKTILDAYV